MLFKINTISQGMTVRFIDLANGSSLQDFLVSKAVESARIGNRAIVFHLEGETIMICFDDATHCRKFHAMVAQIRSEKAISVFKQRTEDSSATQYFQFYGYLSQQQNMMQDFVRTSTYQRAILSNLTDFRDKTILDVGAGSGILSFFAQQAGAKRVYAVEGSSIAKHAESLVKHNKVDNVIKVISGKIEEIELPEKVDMIISEPMGYMLLNERMLETYLHAKKWLKPDGKLYTAKESILNYRHSLLQVKCSPHVAIFTLPLSRTRPCTWSKSTKSTFGTKTSSTAST